MATKNGTIRLLGMMFVCGALASSVLASTCIVSMPSGDRDPHSTLTSSARLIDAIGGASGILSDTSLEARFQTFGASLGIGLTTKPLGYKFSVQ